jgi:hypothetical protein
MQQVIMVPAQPGVPEQRLQAFVETVPEAVADPSPSRRAPDLVPWGYEGQGNAFVGLDALGVK